MIIRKSITICLTLAIAIVFMAPFYAAADEAADLAFIKDPDNKRVVRKWVRKNYKLAALEKMDRHVISTWMEDKAEAAAVSRIEAIEAIWETVNAPSVEKWAYYNSHTIQGDTEKSLEPFGPKSSYTSAEALMNELMENELITSEFTIELTHANTSGDGSIPTNRYMVELYPVDDEGPGLLVDRYVNREMHEISEQWRWTYASKLFERIIADGPSDSYKAKHIDDVESYINELLGRVSWEEPTFPDNCLIEGVDTTKPLFVPDDKSYEIHVLPGIMSTWVDVTNALDAAVAFTEDERTWVACGNSISKKYYDKFCDSSLAGAAVYSGLNCDSASTLGIDYVSRCAFQSVSPGLYKYFVVGYQEEDTGFTCSDFPF